MTNEYRNKLYKDDSVTSEDIRFVFFSVGHTIALKCMSKCCGNISNMDLPQGEIISRVV